MRTFSARENGRKIAVATHTHKKKKRMKRITKLKQKQNKKQTQEKLSERMSVYLCVSVMKMNEPES